MKKIICALFVFATLLAIVSCGGDEPQNCKHKFGNWITISESTCSSNGKQVKICSKCEYTEELELSLKPHTPIVFGAVEPDCFTQGMTAGVYCEVCHTIIEDRTPIPAKGHSFVNGKCVCGAEEGEAQIVVSSAYAGIGDTVEITIAINANPDIASLLLSLEFDNSALTLEKITYSDKIGGHKILPEENESPVKLYWINPVGNTIGDFVLATLRFKVNDNAAYGDHTINLTYDPENVFNFDEENVHFEVVNGKISVS